MAQATEPRTVSAQLNSQDLFLNHARRAGLSVRVHLVDGRHFDAHIKGFDRFALIVDVGGADQLVFKHAIATIATACQVDDDFSSHHP